MLGMETEYSKGTGHACVCVEGGDGGGGAPCYDTNISMYVAVAAALLFMFVLQEVLTDLLEQHEEAHTATVAALAQLAAAMAAAAAAGSSAKPKQQAMAAATIKQLSKQIKGLQRQLLSGAGLRSIIKQASLVEMQREAHSSSSSSSSGGDGGQEDLASWGLRLLRDDGWRSRAQDAFGQGTK